MLSKLIIVSALLTKAIASIFFLAAMLAYTTGIRAEGLSFTVVPHTNDRAGLLRYHIAAKHLSKTLKVPVAFIPSKTYEEAITLFTSSEVQFAWLGGLTGVIARDAVPASVAIAQGFEDQYFESYFIAKKSLGLPYNDSPPKIKPKQYSLLFGPELSTSGRLMPEYYIRKYSRRSPEEMYTLVNFSRNHKDTIEQIVEGEYDIGAVNYREWLTYIQMKKKGSSLLMVVGKTPAYNDYHWVSRPDTKAIAGVTTEQIQQAILSMNHHRDFLRVFNRSHFIRAENKEFTPIIDICSRLGINIKTLYEHKDN